MIDVENPWNIVHQFCVSFDMEHMDIFDPAHRCPTTRRHLWPFAASLGSAVVLPTSATNGGRPDRLCSNGEHQKSWECGTFMDISTYKLTYENIIKKFLTFQHERYLDFGCVNMLQFNRYIWIFTKNQCFLFNAVDFTWAAASSPRSAIMACTNGLNEGGGVAGQPWASNAPSFVAVFPWFFSVGKWGGNSYGDLRFHVGSRIHQFLYITSGIQSFCEDKPRENQLSGIPFPYPVTNWAAVGITAMTVWPCSQSPPEVGIEFGSATVTMPSKLIWPLLNCHIMAMSGGFPSSGSPKSSSISRLECSSQNINHPSIFVPKSSIFHRDFPSNQTAMKFEETPTTQKLEPTAADSRATTQASSAAGCRLVSQTRVTPKSLRPTDRQIHKAASGVGIHPTKSYFYTWESIIWIWYGWIATARDHPNMFCVLLCFESKSIVFRCI